MILDDLNAHLPAAGSIERAAVPPGFFAAWCGQLQLFDVSFREAHERILVRLRYRDLSPAEFFASACAGVLDSAWLSPEPRAFAESYYPQYADDLEAVFGGDLYAVPDDWPHYERIASVLTRRFMAFREDAQPSRRRGRRAGERRWWQVWRS
jgi:hypothetical protein